MEEFRFIELDDETRTELYTVADRYEKFVKLLIESDKGLKKSYRNVCRRLKNEFREYRFESFHQDFYDYKIHLLYNYKIHLLYDYEISIHHNHDNDNHNDNHNDYSNEFNEITHRFIKVVENIKQQLVVGHPLHEILEIFTDANIRRFIDHANKFNLIYVGSLLSFGSVVKIIVQSVDIYSKFRMTDLEREILAKSRAYTEKGIAKFLKDAIDWWLNHLLDNWYLPFSYAVTKPHITGFTPDNDIKGMIPMADLAYEVHSKDVPDPGKKPALILTPVQLTFKNGKLNHKFSLVKDLKGFIGYDSKSESYILAFRGTNVKSLYNILTDIQQILFGADITYLMAIGILSALVEQEQGSKIKVVGHSLGGGLAQYATIAVGGDNLECFCYNSAGLSEFSVNRLKKNHSGNVIIKHLYVPCDVVFLVGEQYGEVSILETLINPISAHLLGTIREQTGVDDIYWIW